jgi:hypothetical protein
MAVSRLAFLVPIIFWSLSFTDTPPGSDPASLPIPVDLISGLPFFARTSRPADWSWLGKPLPSLDRARKWGPLYDLRHADLSRIDLRNWSSICPYIAGLYALACQVKPDITPETFWKAALATGDLVSVTRETKTYIGRIVVPVRLIDSLKQP